jgi:hypothetical protein
MGEEVLVHVFYLKVVEALAKSEAAFANWFGCDGVEGSGFGREGSGLMF